MENIKDLLVIKIEDCLNKKIDRYDLSKWAKNIDHDLLFDYKIMEIDYFVISDFIFDLRMNPDNDEFIGDVGLNRILDILMGNKSFNKSYFMQIPKKFVKKDIHDIKQIISYYKTNHSFSEIYWDNMCDILMRVKEMEILTIPDMVYCNLVSLLASLPPEKESEFYGSTIFIKENDAPNKTEILDTIDKLVQIYECTRIFSVSLFYIKGNVSVSITL